MLDATGLKNVDEVVDKLIERLEMDVFVYRVRPFGPPQILVGSPAQTIEHRPSVAEAEPVCNAFPQ